MNNNKKDNHSRRGLVMLVGQRKRLMKYLGRKDLEKYEKVVTELNIRG
jgi:small subunit ribosomal protein S15